VARPRNKFIDYLQYLALRVFAAFVHMFQVRTSYRTARWIGELMWRVDRRHRRIACGHLRLSFPDWPEHRVQRIARKSMYNMVYLGLELLFTPRLIRPDRWSRHVRLKNMAELIRILVRQETGVILLSGHFGNWEVIGYLMATLGFPTVSVFRPLDNPYVNEYVMGVRERTGQSLLYKKGAAYGMSDVLQQRGALAFVADQDAGRKGLFVDFFGRPASTYRSIALMAIRHRVPVVVGYGRRLGDGFEFEMAVQRIIHPREWAGREDEQTWITQEFTRELEQVVRAAPEQYLWVHRRWKHRPDGTRAAGDGVA
jgi:KDO2-lipid IV(A) lauroyltransferase